MLRLYYVSFQLLTFFLQQMQKNSLVTYFIHLTLFRAIEFEAIALCSLELSITIIDQSEPQSSCGLSGTAGGTGL